VPARGPLPLRLRGPTGLGRPAPAFPRGRRLVGRCPARRRAPPMGEAVTSGPGRLAPAARRGRVAEPPRAPGLTSPSSPACPRCRRTGSRPRSPPPPSP
jgi:hypothetical protein